jgi:hypothetical protein
MHDIRSASKIARSTYFDTANILGPARNVSHSPPWIDRAGLPKYSHINATEDVT